jgi:hypothetical protein
MDTIQFRPRLWWAYLLMVLAFVPGPFLLETRILLAAVAGVTLLSTLHVATEAFAHMPTLALCLGMGIYHGLPGHVVGTLRWNLLLLATPVLAFMMVVVGFCFLPSGFLDFGTLTLKGTALAMNGFVIGQRPIAGIAVLVALATLTLALRAAEEEARA